MANRTYSVEEANASLPVVRNAVERIVDLLPQIPDLQETVRIEEMNNHRAGDTEDSREALARRVADLRSAELSLADALRKLEQMDVALKDPRAGLVDFYGYVDGELVELCWQLGEASVANWHRIGEGYSGRKPLAES